MALFSALCLPVWAGGDDKSAATPVVATVAPDVNPDEIIRKFAAKEK